MLILGIESSCDDSAAAIFDCNSGRILSSIVSSQEDVHAPYGGVVPELASRQHLKNVPHVIERVMVETKCTFSDLSAVAATYGPGLIGSLLVGLNSAKAIAFARKIPFIGVNHLEGHLLSPFLAYRVHGTEYTVPGTVVNSSAVPGDVGDCHVGPSRLLAMTKGLSPGAGDKGTPDIEFPHLGLIVSGGHSSLFLVKGIGDYQLISSTRDDAAGEAFDKVAKFLGLGFPGGRVIDERAKLGDANAIKFPRGMARRDSLDVSFSGLKSAVVRFVQEEGMPSSENQLNDLLASFQEAVVDTLINKVEKAIDLYPSSLLTVSGGVAANSRLRAKLGELAEKKGINLKIASLKYCTDNGAMIAFAGYHRIARGETSPFTLNAKANLPL